MAETRAEARARWSKDHGIPWEQSQAGQAAAASGVSTQENSGAGGAPSAGAPAQPPKALAGLHAGLKSGGGGTIAGGFFGLLLFFTFRAYIQGGMSSVKSFYAAKFVNRTPSQPNPSPTAATAASAPVSSTPAVPWSQALLGSQSPTTASGPALGAVQTQPAPSQPAPVVTAA